MKKLSVFIAALWLVGCSTVRQTAVTRREGTNSVQVTEIRVSALGDAKNLVEKVKATNGATQSLGASGVSQETTSDLLREVIGAAIAAGKAAAK